MTSTPRRPHLLLTNDDGFHAEGIQLLARAIIEAELADVTIVAPSAERSGSGHAITVVSDMPLTHIDQNGCLAGWALDGSPADCVKLACCFLEHERPIDLVVSGINRGINTGILTHYSGTAAAAREATIQGLPSVALSCYYTDPEHVYFPTAVHYGLQIIRRALDEGLPAGVMLNVNVPDLPTEAVRGIRVTRMGSAYYTDLFEQNLPSGSFHPRSVNNVGECYRLSLMPENDFDDIALDQGYISVTPMHIDLTAHQHLERFAAWETSHDPADEV